MNSRDIAALDLAVASGLVQTTTGPLVPGQTAEHGVFEVLAYHLTRCRGRLEDLTGKGLHEELGFATVAPTWRDAWQGSAGSAPGGDGASGRSYPMAIFSSETRRELFSMSLRPEPDPSDPSVDWISPDDLYALWNRGEEEGEARVMIYASYQGHARALQAAVEHALRGGPATDGLAYFPLPDSFLPTPFQGVLHPAQARLVAVDVLLPSEAPEHDQLEGAAEGAWRADVRFSWRATSLVARPRTADYDPRFSTAISPP